MKKIVLSLMLVLSAVVAQAQTNQVPTTPADFIANAKDYLTSFNTNLSWSSTKVDLWTAVNYQNGLQVSDELGASYDFSIATNLAIAPEVVVRNAGIGGTIVDAIGGIGISYEHYDTKVTLYADGGDSLSASTPLVEIGARIKKKMTVSTYTGLGISYQFWFKGKAPTTPSITAFIGWTF